MLNHGGLAKRNRLAIPARLFLAACLAAAMPSALAQPAPPPYTEPPPGSTPAKPPEWAVISIKPNKAEDHGMRFFFTPDGISFNNIPVQMILRQAFDLQDDLIFGAPDWVKSDRYDVEAKVDGADVAALKTIPYDQRSVMLQSLLADRFKLVTHTETRTLPVYELHIAKSGSKLHLATPGDTYPHGLKGPDGAASHGGIMRIERGQFTGQAVSLTVLAKQLSQQLHRTIVDKTGLTGNYDFDLRWAPEQDLGSGPPGPEGSAHDAPPPTDSGPSVFTALEEQLGLKLESTKGPVKTLVIDHIDKPSEN
jgi:uncharacterized protein (TIGR03435 family)